MRLLRLSLTNFRQHADTVLDFRPGLTGIIGPNGSGKTTIFEAIAWAIYGTTGVRGTLDTLRFNRAGGRSRVEAELTFQLGPERYRVVRSLRNAELFRDDGDAPIAAGIAEVTRQLTRRLGMSRDEFFNTYFTEQKQLQFLAAMRPNERRLFLSQVLGYERLKAAQNLAREQRKVLRGQIDELQRGLGEEKDLERAVEEAEGRLRDANRALEATEKEAAETTKHFAELEPEWVNLKSVRERDVQLNETLLVSRARLGSTQEARAKTEAELTQLAAAAKELDALRRQTAPLAGLIEEEETLRGLADAGTKRAALDRQLADQRARVETLSKRHSELEASLAGSAELEGKSKALDEDCAKLEAERDRIRSDWQRDRQDVDARLRILLERSDELKRQVTDIESAGPDGVCATCQRPLGAEYDRVLMELRTLHEETVDEGKWYRQREKQLAKQPAEVADADKRLAEARRARDRAASDLAAAAAARTQQASLAKELDEEKERARRLAGELAALPEGYDAERHTRVRAELDELRVIERKVTQLEGRLEAETRLKAEEAEAQEAARQITAQIEELERNRAELGFSHERFAQVEGEFAAARGARDQAQLVAERARSELDSSRHAAESARRALDEHRKTARLIRERERDQRLHNELDSALGALRDELNDRVRPELSEIASVFLTELTDGRYTQIEIGQDYGILVLDDGEEKPVISGGEEDLANLVLRLAISQMIADRAGQTLSLLIFDEVFGGLDEQRRQSVIGLLQRLQDRFEQVILITHIESIREGMDQVVRVEYDESTGASTLAEETPVLADDEESLEGLVASGLEIGDRR